MITTCVFIPYGRRHDSHKFVQWCRETINYYSTETTWVEDQRAAGFLIYGFGDESDAVAFRLRFGL